MTLNEQLNKRRSELRMSFDDLAARSGVSVATVKRALYGGRGDVSRDNFQSVAEALGIEILLRATVSVTIFREKVAKDKATHLVNLTQGTSALESQAVSRKCLDNLVRETTSNLMAGHPHRLWAL